MDSKKPPRANLVKLETICNETITIYRCADQNLIFVPIDFTVMHVRNAADIATHYAMDLWEKGECDSFTLYLSPAGRGIDVPHVYVILTKGVDTVN